MTTPLVAILGAGASLGSGNYVDGTFGEINTLMPPLTVDLFDEDRYAEVLSKYDLAHQAGRYIVEEMAQDDALGLEHALHDLASSDFPHHKHMALAVPPYLQHLLHAVSAHRHTEALYYDRLIERLLRLPYVFFVSLNYDVLLDRRLNGHHQLDTLDAYIDTNANWSLIKPHGSVNWYHQAHIPYASATPPRDLSWDHTGFHCVPPNADLISVRRTRTIGAEASSTTDRYPALAMPEGPDDRLLLPHAHQEFFGRNLQNAGEIDILVIGYSGLDEAVRNFIGGAGCKVRRMTVVNEDHASAAAVLKRFQESGLDPLWPNVVDRNFAEWVNVGGLNLLIDEYGGPYRT